ncbi:MAG: hypothetical protein NC301_04495 [Bacteroides sp.]|nr:hypothetical protein [Bacteroides sp.]MCM1379717.1 hypothetical protein [Bacteroides sp.]MCM1446072.1 hypothetical protein [Prevotella sp.]
MHIKNVLSALCIAGAALSAVAAEPIYRPTRQTIEEPSDRNPSVLVKNYDSEISYDEHGLPILEIQTYTTGEKLRIITTYTPEGRMATDTTLYLKNGEWILSQTRKREYDPICGAVIVSEEYEYDGDIAYPGNNFHRNLTRDDNGNITLAEIAVYYDGIYDPTRRLTLKYGDDGKPTEITFQELMHDGNAFIWSFGERYTNLMWEKCNGQIWDVADLFSGDNRLASGHFRNDNGSKSYDDYDFTATYADNTSTVVMTGLFHGFENMKNTIISTETTTEDGRVSYIQRRTYEDLNGEYAVEHYLNTNIFDAWGIETEISEYYWENDDEANKEQIEYNYSDVVYDPTYGFPLEYTTYVEGQAVTRVVLSDYVDCVTGQAGIKQITPNSSLPTPNYYDLLGRRVSNPGSGLYIKDGKIIKH